ncbi:MAG TPA: SulP family inorganic anion transporter [Candidatus Eisenbacteria bacterium]|nr:SulP family inorganic anion transporter [Candidatus Eisenbacteria bacterium]
MNLQAWLPKSVTCLREGYGSQDFVRDLIAGVTVGLVALPLAMAFAISSGVPPQSGIYCAIVAGFLISALGGSRTQIGGPTGAFVVVVSGIVLHHGIDGLFLCTLLAGVFLVILGATGMGTAVDYIPRPVVVGFTNGIAVVIASTQIEDFFGLHLEHPASTVVPRLQQALQGIDGISVPATVMSAASLLVLVTASMFWKRVPGAILVLVLGTAATALLAIPVDTIGSRFGGIPQGLPRLVIPVFRPELIGPLLSPAVTVALLGAIESLMSATVSDRMSGDRHNPNVELVAQGVANIASPLVGGLPATGAIARTATNIRSGARTPVAGMIHALTLLAVLVLAAPLARFVPLPALAAILLMVAYNMGDWGEIPELLRMGKSDISVWLITFALTVFADLTLAVEVGMVLAALLFIRKVAVTTEVEEITSAHVEEDRTHRLVDRAIPDDVTVFRIRGPFLFGSTEKLEAVGDRASLTPIVILRLRDMTAIDATGLTAIEELAGRLRDRGSTLLLCGAREQPKLLMRKAEFERHVGEENFCENIEQALARAAVIRAGTEPTGPARAADPTH